MTDRMPTDGEANLLCEVAQPALPIDEWDIHGSLLEAGWMEDCDDAGLTLSGYDALIRWLAAKRVALEKEGAGE